MTSNTIKCHIDFPAIFFCKYDKNLLISAILRYFSTNFVNGIV